jgi:L-asparaginase II
MTDPVVVEVTRGPLVESRHRGAVAIVDAAGRVGFALGDVAQPVFPRSAVKALQALALVESGAADRYGFGNAELALACSSHSGEPEHVVVARRMLAATGRSESDLECGAQVPSNHAAAEALVRAGVAPGPVHNNCSGKHSGFIAVAAHRGVPVAGYVRPEHTVQRQVTSILSELTDTALDHRVRGIDGCSIPTYGVPLDRIALAFARFVSSVGLSPARWSAARRLFDACSAEPFLVAGTGRFDTEALSLFPRRMIVKGGAEGVYCGGFPQLGLGVAIKCDDGAGRASETVMAAVIAELLALDEAERRAFADRLAPPILNRRGMKVGEIRLAEGVGAELQAARAAVS